MQELLLGPHNAPCLFLLVRSSGQIPLLLFTGWQLSASVQTKNEQRSS